MSQKILLSRYEEERETQNQSQFAKHSIRFIQEALAKGLDVAHMPNGDFVITETKTITHCYRWNENVSRFDRVNRLAKKSRHTKSSGEAS